MFGSNISRILTMHCLYFSIAFLISSNAMTVIQHSVSLRQVQTPVFKPGWHSVIETVIRVTISCPSLALVVDIAYLMLIKHQNGPKTTVLETFTSQEHASTALNGASEERKKPARCKTEGNSPSSAIVSFLLIEAVCIAR